jgi:GNAT superfamily N-acetyltransferase
MTDHEAERIYQNEHVTVPRYKITRMERTIAKLRRQRDEAREELARAYATPSWERQGYGAATIRRLEQELAIHRVQVDRLQTASRAIEMLKGVLGTKEKA